MTVLFFTQQFFDLVLSTVCVRLVQQKLDFSYPLLLRYLR